MELVLLQLREFTVLLHFQCWLIIAEFFSFFAGIFEVRSAENEYENGILKILLTKSKEKQVEKQVRYRKIERKWKMST